MQSPGKLSKTSRDNYKRLFASLRKRKKSADDLAFAEIHNEVFNETHCLECANCCKSYPPLIIQQDIERIAAYLQMKETDFLTKYIEFDEDGDSVFRIVPCTFLNSDNTCSIYDVRPRACKEYPHTNRKKIYQIEKQTLMNAEICPAVGPILEKMRQKIMI